MDVVSDTGTRIQRGRYIEAERNDAAILEAARATFVADPNAPISAVAKRAGVGIGAIYNRYGSKETLLGTLCAIGQDVYLDEVSRALDSNEDPGESYFEFLRRIVADGHRTLVSWTDEGQQVLDPEIAAKWQQGDAPSTAEQVRERALSALAQEAALMLEEGVVAEAADIDLALLTGAGWPFWLGGITPYLDRTGVSERTLGRRFTPPGINTLPA